jgi:uncharacterized protein YrrD
LLFSLKELQDYTVQAADGELGAVHDFLFDDQEWTIRYLVVDTSGWLDRERALIPSDSLLQPDGQSLVIPVASSQEQVKNRPPIDPDEHRRDDPHLHSAQSVMGYRVQARDGQAGSVEDFLVSDETWHIQFMVVDTGMWLAGRKVLTALQWVEQISEPEETVTMDLAQSTIGNSPEYDPTALSS